MSDELPANLERIAAQLDAAWRPARSSRRPFLIGGACITAVALAALLALTLDLGGGPGPRGALGVASARAAIARAREVLARPERGVFHVVIESRSPGEKMRVNEIWQAAGSLRTLNTDLPESGMRTGGIEELYDRTRNVIYAARTSSADPGALVDAYTAASRRLLSSPAAHVAGHTTIDGVDCLRIVSTAVRGTSSTLFVDAHTYRLVLERDENGASIRFRVWQTLPRDTESIRLADVRRIHPHARVIGGTSALYAAKVRLEHLIPGPPGQPPRPRPSTSSRAGVPTTAQCAAAYNVASNDAARAFARRVHSDRAFVAGVTFSGTPGCMVKLWLPRRHGDWQDVRFEYGVWRSDSVRFTTDVDQIPQASLREHAHIRTPLRWGNASIAPDGRISRLVTRPGGLPPEHP